MKIADLLKRANFDQHWLRIPAAKLWDSEMDQLKDALYDQLVVESMAEVARPAYRGVEIK